MPLPLLALHHRFLHTVSIAVPQQEISTEASFLPLPSQKNLQRLGPTKGGYERPFSATLGVRTNHPQPGAARPGLPPVNRFESGPAGQFRNAGRLLRGRAPLAKLEASLPRPSTQAPRKEVPTAFPPGTDTYSDPFPVTGLRLWHPLGQGPQKASPYPSRPSCCATRPPTGGPRVAHLHPGSSESVDLEQGAEALDPKPSALLQLSAYVGQPVGANPEPRTSGIDNQAVSRLQAVQPIRISQVTGPSKARAKDKQEAQGANQPGPPERERRPGLHGFQSPAKVGSLKFMDPMRLLRLLFLGLALGLWLTAAAGCGPKVPPPPPEFNDPQRTPTGSQRLEDRVLATLDLAEMSEEELASRITEAAGGRTSRGDLNRTVLAMLQRGYGAETVRLLHRRALAATDDEGKATDALNLAMGLYQWRSCASMATEYLRQRLNSGAFLVRSLCLWRDGDEEGARDNFAAAQKMSPLDPPVIEQIARLIQERGDPGQLEPSPIEEHETLQIAVRQHGPRRPHLAPRGLGQPPVWRRVPA